MTLALRFARLLSLASLLVACAAAPPVADASSYPADGPFVRHLRVRVAPSHTQAFEQLLALCVETAGAAGLEEDWDWLGYRESPGRYWIITFGEAADAPLVVREAEPLRAFVHAIAANGGEATVREVERRLSDLECEVEWNLVARMSSEWSTVQEMSTHTHPKARLMLRTVRPGHEAAFARALTARTEFFREHDYPLPVEGFVILEGLPGHAMQVVFPRDWPSFHGSESFWAFVQSRAEPERADYMERKAALMATMASAEYLDADFLPAASYGGEG